jgi:hypothetical protein
MTPTQSFIAWHADRMDMSHVDYHAACGAALARVADVDTLAIPFCPTCRVIDEQGVEAYRRGIAWLGMISKGERLADVYISEYCPFDDPGITPPVPQPYVRLWSIGASWGEANDEGEKPGVDGLIALLPDGSYHLDANTYPRCEDITNHFCPNYVVPNADGTYTCPEHGVVRPESDEDLGDPE